MDLTYLIILRLLHISCGPEQVQQLSIYRKKIIAANNIAAILLAASVIAMSVSRYL